MEKLSQEALALIFNEPIYALGKKKKETSEAEDNKGYLGENGKKVLILVSYPNALHLPTKELALLENILKALQMGLQDVAVVNLAKNKKTYQELEVEFQFEKLVLFNVNAFELGLKDVKVNLYELNLASGKQILSSDSLEKISADFNKKKALWAGLQRMFL